MMKMENKTIKGNDNKRRKLMRSCNEGFNDKIMADLAEIARINIDDISRESLIREELGLDSLTTIEIVSKVERKYNIKINESQLFKITSVGDFVKLVALLMSKGNKKS